MVRTARLAFDDPEDGRRASLDDFEDECDDPCFEIPPSAAAAEPAPSRNRTGAADAIDTEASVSPTHVSQSEKAA